MSSHISSLEMHHITTIEAGSALASTYDTSTGRYFIPPRSAKQVLGLQSVPFDSMFRRVLGLNGYTG